MIITHTPMFWGGFVSSWMAHPASDYLTVGWALSRSDAHTRCPGVRTSPSSSFRQSIKPPAFVSGGPWFSNRSIPLVKLFLLSLSVAATLREWKQPKAQGALTVSPQHLLCLWGHPAYACVYIHSTTQPKCIRRAELRLDLRVTPKIAGARVHLKEMETENKIPIL